MSSASLAPLTPIRPTPQPSASLIISSLLFFVLPWLVIVRYVPDWFPGTGWKVKGKILKGLLEEMVEVPFQFVKDQMVSR